MGKLPLAVLLVGLAACSSSPMSTPAAVAPSGSQGTSGPRLGIDPSSVGRKLRVGAWVNPQAGDGGPKTIDALEKVIGRPLDDALHYHAFATGFPSAAELDDLARGRMPVVSMACGDTQAMLAGALDAQIDALATAITSFGAQIEFRYCDEMNLPKAGIDAGDFVANWSYAHARLAADGVTNVRWFWCPSDENADPTSGIAYWPGAGTVDDAGFDAYDDFGVGLEGLLDPIYPAYAALGKPLIVGETGATASLDQATYLTAASAQLIHERYPKIAGLLYFDAPGSLGDWSLSPAGLVGFGAFARTVAAAP